MDDQRLEKILRHWPLPPEPIEIQRLESGISSRACRIQCGTFQGVLREIASQAQTEAEFARVLAPQGLTARIFLTQANQTYVQDQGQLYNLQEYLQPAQNKPRGVALALRTGQRVAQMQKVLLQSPMSIAAAADRFSSARLREEADRRIALFPSAITAQQYTAIQALAKESRTLRLRGDQPMHGDLGLWNMLWTTSGLRVIDFGEARLGDFYFDIAASLSSLLQSESDCSRHAPMIRAFLNSYEETFQTIDRVQCSKAIRLWLLRGMLAVIAYRPPESWKALITPDLALISSLGAMLNA